MLKTIARQLNKYELKVALKRNIFTSARLTADENPKKHAKPKEKEIPTILVETDDRITLIGINRPDVRNAIDDKTANRLCDAFTNFENDEESSVAVLYGVGESFCAGYDLAELGDDEKKVSYEILFAAEGSVGPTRRHISKPVICAINGFCVANGLELALMCDLRVMEATATIGFYNRRLCIPMMDGGSARLPAIIGFSRALDLILTGRKIESDEAFQIGLVNRIVPTCEALNEAINIAHSLARYPQASLLHDRKCLYNAQFEAQGFNATVQNEILLTSANVMSDMKMGILTFNECKGKLSKCLSKVYREKLKKDQERIRAKKKAAADKAAAEAAEKKKDEGKKEAKKK